MAAEGALPGPSAALVQPASSTPKPSEGLETSDLTCWLTGAMKPPPPPPARDSELVSIKGTPEKTKFGEDSRFSIKKATPKGGSEPYRPRSPYGLGLATRSDVQLLNDKLDTLTRLIEQTLSWKREADEDISSVRQEMKMLAETLCAIRDCIKKQQETIEFLSKRVDELECKPVKENCVAIGIDSGEAPAPPSQAWESYQSPLPSNQPRQQQETLSIGSHKSDEEEVIREVKNFRYWANKISQVFRRVRTSTKKRRKSSFNSLFSSFEGDIEDLEGETTRFRPEAIDTLCQLTKFNKRELQLMYRGFKQECPSGMVKEDTFKGLYAQFFPRGADTSQYAHYVFNTFDQDHTGAITFTDFVIGLSVLARGSLQEKLRWAFSLYDINGDGYITKEEMTRIINAIYDLMGRAVEPLIEDATTREHVDRVFQRLDLNKDGVVTIDEFLDSCTRDERITQSISVFDTML